MNYQDTVSWMFAQLPMYQNKGTSAYRKDLTNIKKFAKHLNHPETKFKSVHVAGTNGKGSTSHMTASILQEAGYKVGLYTSPHLKDFRERIKINGKAVSKQFVIQFIRRNTHFLNENKLSFFEMTVGMAFDYFAKRKVDIAIIEVGLGGRLDSTNIIIPEVSIITNIGFDHMTFLGSTLKEIAAEKGGIIKPEIPVVIGETQSETVELFMQLAKLNRSQIYFANEEISTEFSSDLKGNYQKLNIKSAVQAINILIKKGFKIDRAHIVDGLNQVIKNTGLMGRWQVVNDKPRIICDTAHNKEGLKIVLDQLLNETFADLHMVLGFVNDKDLSSLFELFPKNAKYYLCRPNIERGLNVEQLKNQFDSHGFESMAFNSVNEALKEAKKRSKPSDLIYVGGSTFVVAEVL